MSQDKDAEAFLKACKDQDLSFLDDEPYSIYLDQLKKDLSKDRYDHSLRVLQAGLTIADRFHLNRQKTATACLLHDCAKHNEKKYFQALLEDGLVEEDDWSPSPVFHSVLGGKVAKYFYGVEDEEILDAIAQHTTGGKDMTDLAKITFVADMIEVERDFPGVNDLRSEVWSDLDKGSLACMNQSIRHLLDKNSTIDYTTIEARNSLIKEIREENQ